ncbi:hypothetical protein FBU30_007139 [Linnemannia zychae]|nr:hypothetical protein FBU30_007139 [Linnemannia zychae]
MVENDLDIFYNRSNFAKHHWDARRARQEEFSRVANSLLQMVGGTIGEKRREDQKVVIVIGLAKFVAKNGPPSLDGAFQDYFVRKVRLLGYVVCGINEFYTSQRCPDCCNFVWKTTEWRSLWCSTCKIIWQRDIMAAKNMCRATKSHLLHRCRPMYLQPQRSDGTYPWQDQSPDAASSTSSHKRRASVSLLVEKQP